MLVNKNVYYLKILSIMKILGKYVNNEWFLMIFIKIKFGKWVF